MFAFGPLLSAKVYIKLKCLWTAITQNMIKFREFTLKYTIDYIYKYYLKKIIFIILHTRTETTNERTESTNERTNVQTFKTLNERLACLI